MDEYYVYGHYVPGEDTPFYIGKGMGARAYILNGRSGWWHRVANKYGVEVKILVSNLTEQAAFDKEKELIKHFGRRNTNTGCLINLTDGGEGPSGVVVSDATRLKLSTALKGRIHTEEARKKLSDGRKGIKFSDEHRRKISDVMKTKIGELNSFHGRHHTIETKTKISENRKNRAPWNKGIKMKPMAEEQRIKISVGLKNKPKSEEHRKKLSDAIKNQQKIQCPHCNKSGRPSNIKRYHFNNCKLKQTLDNTA